MQELNLQQSFELEKTDRTLLLDLDDQFENFKLISSLVAKEQVEFAKQGLSQSESRKKAAEDVAAHLLIPTTGSSLETWLARARNFLYSDKKRRTRVKKWGRPQKNMNPSEMRSIYQLYKEWFKNHDTVASDSELAHFSRQSREAFACQRRVLTGEGYVFEKRDGELGWKVKCPPPKPEVKKESKLTAPPEIKELFELIKKKYEL